MYVPTVVTPYCPCCNPVPRCPCCGRALGWRSSSYPPGYEVVFGGTLKSSCDCVPPSDAEAQAFKAHLMGREQP